MDSEDSRSPSRCESMRSVKKKKPMVRAAPKMNLLHEAYHTLWQKHHVKASELKTWRIKLETVEDTCIQRMWKLRSCSWFLLHSLEKESRFMVFSNQYNPHIRSSSKKRLWTEVCIYSKSIFNLALFAVRGTSFNRFWFPIECHSLTHVIDIIDIIDVIDVIRERVVSTWANAAGSCSCFGHSRQLRGLATEINTRKCVSGRKRIGKHCWWSRKCSKVFLLHL